MALSVRMLISLLFAVFSGFSVALAVGDTAPLFKGPLMSVLDSPTGNTNRFDSKVLRGHVSYIDFWASWCGPCRVSLPALNSLYQEYKSQGFRVVAINEDQYRDDAVNFLKERPLYYPVIFDAEQKLPEVFGVKGMPTAFLLDRQGRVHHIHEGFRPGDGYENDYLSTY